MTASAKDLAAELGRDIKTLKGTIQPLLKDWLLGTNEGVSNISSPPTMTIRAEC